MEDLVTTSYMLGLFFAALLALIPASIASKKGRSFGLWWLYGWALWIVAIIHVSMIDDKKDEPLPSYYDKPEFKNKANLSVADEIKKYKDLLDSGVITEEEFQEKKNQLLKKL